MSASLWDWSAASADGLLTNEECSMLLDADIFDDDLLKTFPNAAPKVEAEVEAGKLGLPEEISASLYPPSPPESKPSRAELADDLLHQLDNHCKQENIFPNWLEEKVELPIFESIPAGAGVELGVGVGVGLGVGSYPAAPLAHAQPQPTEELLREFESVYGAVELTHLTHLTHLTPPQSPPGPATQLLLSYAHQAQCVPLSAPTPTPTPAAAPGPAAPAPEPWQYDSELAAVEELVRRRAAELASPEPPSSSGSPRSSPPSSPRSSTDEEWASRSPRAKPYARSPDDRRSRKKEQNKNAATRYRQKKKAEVEVLLGEEQQLRATHGALGERCADLQREIRYLKGLMRDLFKAKGLIK